MNHDVQELLTLLKKEKIETWFDLGLFIDRVRENRKVPSTEFKGSFQSFKNHLEKEGIGFITYQLAVDGVTVEIEKYTKIFRNILPEMDVHYITGDIYPEAQQFIDPFVNQHIIKEISGFDRWPLYQDFFFAKLERGNKVYNELIIKFWEEVLTIVDLLGRYIQAKKIGLLYLVNVCSNPGNVSLSLAVVLL